MELIVVPVECLPQARLHRPNSDYARDVDGDFAQIAPYLPEKAETIIDIGCGLAGIDVYLRRKYPRARLSLLDGEGSHGMYWWNDVCIPYGSRKAAEMLLAANGCSYDEWIEAGTKATLKADLVVSLLSWGFHYPLSTYDVRGFCVADLFKKTEPPRGTVIMEHKYSNRCAFKMRG